ncbi:hypothetical protein [Maribacter thermophilus]|uniref:hypothetical protein n=1 Tax=Maribacter thermophilus TaxID=1197874 RepID=UPI000AAE6A5B|nr:hypothetical protein [Maribacter thermophilus]
MVSWTFIKENYFMIGYAITLLISLATYRKYYDTALKYFPIIITYTFFNEVLGFLVRNYDDISFFKNLKYSNVNEVIYNIYAIIFFGFFFQVYWFIIDNKKYKKWIVTGAVIAFLAYAISLLYQNPIETNLFYAIALSAWVLVLCTVLYFKNMLRQGHKFYQAYNLMFWVSIALFIFHLVFPVLFVIGYTNYDIWAKYELKSVLKVFIVIMYTLFIIGFLKGRRMAFR